MAADRYLVKLLSADESLLLVHMHKDTQSYRLILIWVHAVLQRRHRRRCCRGVSPVAPLMRMMQRKAAASASRRLSG